MSTIYDLIKSAEAELEGFIQWQIENGPSSDLHSFARKVISAETLIYSAEILWPECIEVEGAIVLAQNYREKQWKELRNDFEPLQAADMMNHVQVVFFLEEDLMDHIELRDAIGNVVALFWRVSLRDQFPRRSLEVEYRDGSLSIWQFHEGVGS